MIVPWWIGVRVFSRTGYVRLNNRKTTRTVNGACFCLKTADPRQTSDSGFNQNGRYDFETNKSLRHHHWQGWCLKRKSLQQFYQQRPVIIHLRSLVVVVISPAINVMGPTILPEAVSIVGQGEGMKEEKNTLKKASYLCAICRRKKIFWYLSTTRLGAWLEIW